MDTKKSEIEELVTRFEEDGYVVLKLEGIDDLIDEINADVENLLASGEYRTNSKIYSYNESPRIVESWKYSHASHKLAFNSQVMDFLSNFFTAEPLPFSTINFLRSTEQPLHSDYIHFGTIPHLRLAASWVALEDIDPKSGPLQIVVGSHNKDIVCFSDISPRVARSLGDVKENYTLYEDYIRSMIKATDLEVVSPVLKKGEAIIWNANLLHGSPSCENNQLSRRSQVTHYHFSETEMFYNPSFSSLRDGRFVRRNVEFLPNPAAQKL
jgi:ectoine hydroxylase-related dioxygenase (phytanoyl-CoA dioxygenase family)